MTADQYFYIYSGMAQATAGLIALIGIFIVFRLELQRNRIRNCRDTIESITYVDTFLPLKTFIAEVETYISTCKEGGRTINGHDSRELAQKYLENFKRHINNLHHTIKYGGIGIGLTALLFLSYAAILYWHSKFRLPDQQLYLLWATFVGLFLTILYLIWFIYDILKNEAKEYSTK